MCRVCFPNEHVSFAATNPIENLAGPSIWPKSSLESPEARKRNCPEQSENRSVALCQVVRGAALLHYYYVSVLFSLIYPSLLCESVLLFVLSKKKKVDSRSFMCPGNTIERWSLSRR